MGYKVHTSQETSESRVVQLNDIHGPSRSSNGHTETEEETTTHELTRSVRRRLNSRSNNDKGGTDQHAHAATEAVDAGADKGEGDDATDLVHGGDDAGPEAVVLDLVSLPEPGVLEQVVDEGAVVSVHGAAEEADEGEGVEEHLAVGPEAGGLLEHGFVEGLATLDDFVLNLGLDREQAVSQSDSMPGILESESFFLQESS